MPRSPGPPVPCRECGRPLTDRVSRLFRVGTCCIKKLSDEEKAEALRLTLEENKPGYIPPQRPPSARARRNNAEARAVVAVANDPEQATCEPHGGVLGACPQCRYEADADNASKRIIDLVQKKRRNARNAAYLAHRAAHVDQLELELECT